MRKSLISFKLLLWTENLWVSNSLRKPRTQKTWRSFRNRRPLLKKCSKVVYRTKVLQFKKGSSRESWELLRREWKRSRRLKNQISITLTWTNRIGEEQIVMTLHLRILVQSIRRELPQTKKPQITVFLASIVQTCPKSLSLAWPNWKMEAPALETKFFKKL